MNYSLFIIHYQLLIINYRLLIIIYQLSVRLSGALSKGKRAMGISHFQCGSPLISNSRKWCIIYGIIDCIISILKIAKPGRQQRWLCAPRVSCGAAYVHPVCLVRVAVWPTCVLCGWFYAPLVFFCIGQPQKAHGVQTQGRVQRHSCAHTVCKIGCLRGAGPRGARPVSVSQFCSVIVSKHIQLGPGIHRFF